MALGTGTAMAVRTGIILQNEMGYQARRGAQPHRPKRIHLRVASGGPGYLGEQQEDDVDE